MSGMLDWAKREIEIACKKERGNAKKDEFDYGCACYESALKAFESLLEDGHSGFSIKITQSILDRLLNGQPLTPIEDTDDIWSDSVFSVKGIKTYQCKRMSSLFKDVYPDGTIGYHDVDRLWCFNINNPTVAYSSSLVRRVIDDMFPITMPYTSSESDSIKVYCEDFLTDKKNGDFDTVGVFYVLKTEAGKQEKIDINRFFRVSEDDEPGAWTEISKEEYDERKLRKINK